MRLKLVVFDVDGTLVDSQNDIVHALTEAFAAQGRQPPSRAEMLSIVGLSLPHAFEVLAPDASPEDNARLVAAYKAAWFDARAGGAEGAPLFPGARELIEELAQVPEVLLGIATGKSRRGLDIVLEQHGLTGRFHAIQTSDGHPSKPHPAMLSAVLADCGVETRDAVMLGDTSFDMEMARAASVPGIGVSWGYHPPQALIDAGALLVLNDFAALRDALSDIWS